MTQHRRTGRWEAHVWDGGKQTYLGGFDSEARAGRAYGAPPRRRSHRRGRKAAGCAAAPLQPQEGQKSRRRRRRLPLSIASAAALLTFLRAARTLLL